MNAWTDFFRPSPMVSGFVAVLVGYSTSVAIIFQAAQGLGATDAQITSWLWALGLGMGLSSIALTLYFRQPILTAWSTPGAALLVTSLSGVSLEEALGGFLLSSLAITLVGLTGWMDRLVRWVPGPLAAAMLAGVLLPFCLDAFVAVESQPVLVGTMVLVFLVSPKQWAVPFTLIIGVVTAWHLQLFHWPAQAFQLGGPVWTTPEFSVIGLINVALALFVITMVSQNLPGLMVLKSHGHQAPAKAAVSVTGITGCLLAPFGGFAFNLAAITAALCMTDTKPERRYLATFWAGVSYCTLGVLGASVTALLIALPMELVTAVAGLALLTTFGNSMVTSLSVQSERLAALITFAVTASGVNIIGISSSFWGLGLGLLVLLFNRLQAQHSRSYKTSP